MRNEVLIEILPLVFHKLKNKLTPVLGYTQILQARGRRRILQGAAGADRKEHDRTDRRAELPEGLLQARARVAETPAAINRILEELAAGLAGDRQRRRGARRPRAGRPACPSWRSTPASMRVLLLNLVDNALLALKAGAGRRRRDPPVRPRGRRRSREAVHPRQRPRHGRRGAGRASGRRSIRAFPAAPAWAW